MSCEAMEVDFQTEVGPTEETIDALLDYLVGPLLSFNHSDIATETPSEAQQKSAAKQAHAAAVLYNYFHLNHHQKESQFLKFDQFCNLAIMFNPSILHHMKYMCQSGRPILDDPENQLSLTEKSIMDACILSETLLNASDNISNVIKEWSITKVAVLLLDSKMENCFLKFDDFVWSVIEIDLYPESKKHKETIINHDEEVEAGFQKLAFLAVEEATGNVNGELKVLESHVVYSLSQAKTATRFYILQSIQSISENDRDPIKDTLCRVGCACLCNSLQEPVVKENLGSWVITPIVEFYYYLLPYAEIMSQFFSRVSNSSPNHVEKISLDANIFQGSQNSCEIVDDENKVSVDFQKKSKLDSKSEHVSNSSNEEPCDSKFTQNIYKSNNSSDGFISYWLMEDPFDQEVRETKKSTNNSIKIASNDSKKEDMNGSCEVKSNNSSNGAISMSIDKSLMVYHVEKKSTPTNSINSKEHVNDLKKKSTSSQSKDEKVDGGLKSCMVSPNVDKTPTMYHDLEVLQSSADAKRSELSEAAIRVLLNKRQKLYHQQEVIENELTLCDKKIQTIMHGGIRDCLDLKLDVIIDCCNEICNQEDNMQTQEHTNLHVAKCLPLLPEKSLNEAQLTLRQACQELDDICLSNNWMLPTYKTSRSDGGIVANVTVKGTNFECTGLSGIQPSILEARNSAATNAITRLLQMANEMNV